MKRTAQAVQCTDVKADDPPTPKGGRGFTPSPDQQKALEAIAEGIADREIVSVIGRGGTGKSTILAEAIHQAHEQGEVVMGMAFTHRACRVVRRKLAAAGITGVEVKTSSSALGFREVRSEGELPKFERVAEANFGDASVVMADEMSMLPAAHVDALRAECQLRDMGLVLFGDKRQLKPPGHRGRHSPAFDLPGVTVELTRVHRNAGPILELADRIADSTPGRLPALSSASAEGSDVIVHADKRSFRQAIETTLRQHLADGIDDGFRVLAGPNATVRSWNQFCREIALGADAAPFVKGELLLGLGPIFDWRDAGDRDTPPVCGASAELEVVSEPEEVLLPNPRRNRWLIDMEIRAYRLAVRGDQFTGVLDLFAVASEDHETYQQLLNHLGDEASALKGKPKGAKSSDGYLAWELWNALFVMRDLLGHLSGPRYASTVHKSQGGEWETCFVDLPSFGAWRKDPHEHRSMAYTACSRAQKVLHVIGG